MDGIAVSGERLASTGTGVTDVGTALTKEIGVMQDMLGQIRSGWQSDQAAPRFAVTMQGYLDDASRLKDALLSHGQSLLDTGRAFDQAEAEVAATFPAGA